MPIRTSRFDVSSHDRSTISRLLDDVHGPHKSISLDSVLRQARTAAQELPRALREFIYEFSIRELEHATCIFYEVEERWIGPTPTQYRPSGEEEVVDRHTTLHVLLASLLGEPFTWSTIQSGYLVNDIIPIPEHAAQVASSGSSAIFDLHTEDAFHSCAGAFLGLFLSSKYRRRNRTRNY